MRRDNVQLLLGDCLELMEAVPAASIDMVLCDMPYGTTQCAWDRCIDLKALWKAYKRVVKSNAAIVLFASQPFTSTLIISNLDWYRYNLVWERDRASGFLNAKRMPLRAHEDICIFYAAQPTYNPQMWQGRPEHGIGSRNGHKHKPATYGDMTRVDHTGNCDKHPRSVIRFQCPHPPVYPTQKPVDLFRWLIRTYSNEGQVVLDNCMGSGTCALACLAEGRSFIGMDVNSAAVELAKVRTAEEEDS